MFTENETFVYHLAGGIMHVLCAELTQVRPHADSADTVVHETCALLSPLEVVAALAILK